jgi:nitrate/nitrite transporter NarK
MAGPIIDGGALADHLGGQADPELCDLIAAAISAVIAALVDAPAEPETEWAAEATTAALMAGADMFKAATGTGGGYQLDATSYTDVYRMTPTFLRRYEPLFANVRAIGGMIG